MIDQIRHFNRFYARVLGVFTKKYLGSSLSMTEVRILGEISRKPGMTASDISALLGLDKSYLSRTIKHLETENLIWRKQSVDNWRSQNLYLTREGETCSFDLDVKANERIEQQIATLSEEDRALLVSSMQTIERLLSPIIPPEVTWESLRIMQCQMGDVDQAMALIDGAKTYLKAQGIDQWQSGYPDRACIQYDIESAKGFFLRNGKDTVIGYLCIDPDGEPAYDTLNGTWLTGVENRQYMVVHRLALSNENRGKGYASLAFEAIERYAQRESVKSIRMDTDDDNQIMKHLLQKHGYTYCGKIRFDNSDKIAYEKILL